MPLNYRITGETDCTQLPKVCIISLYKRTSKPYLSTVKKKKKGKTKPSIKEQSSLPQNYNSLQGKMVSLHQELFLLLYLPNSLFPNQIHSAETSLPVHKTFSQLKDKLTKNQPLVLSSRLVLLFNSSLKMAVFNKTADLICRCKSLPKKPANLNKNFLLSLSLLFSGSQAFQVSSITLKIMKGLEVTQCVVFM